MRSAARRRPSRAQPRPHPAAHGEAALQTNTASLAQRPFAAGLSGWICGALALSIMGLPGFQAHWVPYLVDIDFNREVAASALFVFGLGSVSARFVWGYLTARHDIRNLMVIQALLAALGILFLLTVQNTVMMYAWAIYHGLTLAVFFQLQTLLVVTYFGRRNIGAIRGVMFPFITLGSATGPILLGRSPRLARLVPGAVLPGDRHVVVGRAGRVHDAAAAARRRARGRSRAGGRGAG